MFKEKGRDPVKLSHPDPTPDPWTQKLLEETSKLGEG